jgi:glucosamine--fructose-6-phosphate aminotransferase (isomerizing)
MSEPIIPREIAEGPAAIRATITAAEPVAAEIGSRLRRDGIRRVHVIGNGTSYHSSLAAAALYQRHAGPDDPTVVPMTAGSFQAYGPALGDGDAIVGISASGEFRDVVAAARDSQGRRPFIGIVHVPGSTLVGLASDVVLSAGGTSDVPVMTKTFSATLVATELVLLGLLGPERAGPVVDDLSRAADHAEATIAAAGPVAAAVAEELLDTEHVFVVGAGLAHIAALEAALKLKEMALVHAEGTETWEMASGAATIIGPGSVVVALAPDGPGRAATADVVRHAAGWGARIIDVGPRPLTPDAMLIAMPADAMEDHAPLSAVPPIALIADALARRRGLDPDRPGWVERYHSQGLRHILGVGDAGR